MAEYVKMLTYLLSRLQDLASIWYNCIFFLLSFFMSIVGTITCLAFCDNSHMLSGSDDGTVCVWECKTWDCLKVLKGHR